MLETDISYDENELWSEMGSDRAKQRWAKYHSFHRDQVTSWEDDREEAGGDGGGTGCRMPDPLAYIIHMYVYVYVYI